MIKNFIPYSEGKDLVFEYNECMSLLKNGDWAVFLDHDAVPTTHYWRNRIQEYIDKFPETSCFVATTNRVGGERMLDKTAPQNNDITSHRKHGLEVYNLGLVLEDFTDPTPHHLSGVCFALSHKAWEEIGGFKQWSEKSNILGVDSKLHQDLNQHGLKTGIMKSIYVYHWYSGWDGLGSRDKQHLKTVAQ